MLESEVKAAIIKAAHEFANKDRRESEAYLNLFATIYQSLCVLVEPRPSGPSTPTSTHRLK